MTLIGLFLVLVGAAVGLPGVTTFNGQWLLGLLIAITGVVLCGVHTFRTKEKK